MKSKISFKGEKIKYAVFLLAPALFFYILFFVELDKNNPAITATLAVAILMALWWVTEIVSLTITSLLPVILFLIYNSIHFRYGQNNN